MISFRTRYTPEVCTYKQASRSDTSRFKSRRAFTLIELLIVITIIGILAVALIPKIASAPGRARDAQRKTDLNTIAIALEAYYADYGTYPSDSAGNCIDSISGFSSYFNASDIPNDPTSTNAVGSCTATYYWYNYVDSGAHYIIGANLENDASATASPGTVKYGSVSAVTTLGSASVVPYKTILSGETCTATGPGTTMDSNSCIYVIGK